MSGYSQVFFSEALRSRYPWLLVYRVQLHLTEQPALEPWPSGEWDSGCVLNKWATQGDGKTTVKITSSLIQIFREERDSSTPYPVQQEESHLGHTSATSGWIRREGHRRLTIGVRVFLAKQVSKGVLICRLEQQAWYAVTEGGHWGTICAGFGVVGESGRFC